MSEWRKEETKKDRKKYRKKERKSTFIDLPNRIRRDDEEMKCSQIWCGFGTVSA
jgi:hypothetical protein